jgi:hypothetical protein
VYRGWSDGGAQTHVVTAPASATTYIATYVGATPVYQPATTVRWVDSQETVNENGSATNVLDGNPATIWHTRYTGAQPGHPHEIQFDLGAPRAVSSLSYLPRQDGYTNGRIAQYDVSVSNDPAAWGTPVATGTFANTATWQTATFAARLGRYVRLRALSAFGGGPWTSAAEISVGAAGLPSGVATVRSVDSQETVAENGAATNALDGLAGTRWHTRYSGAQPPPPHEIQLDLGSIRPVMSVQYTPRQDTYSNGRIGQFEVYVSDDPGAWGPPVATGTFADSTAQQSVVFGVKLGRYVRLRALSEVNGGPWTSAAEVGVGVARLPQNTITVRSVGRRGTCGCGRCRRSTARRTRPRPN